MTARDLRLGIAGFAVTALLILLVPPPDGL